MSLHIATRLAAKPAVSYNNKDWVRESSKRNKKRIFSNLEHLHITLLMFYVMLLYIIVVLKTKVTTMHL